MYHLRGEYDVYIGQLGSRVHGGWGYQNKLLDGLVVVVFGHYHQVVDKSLVLHQAVGVVLLVHQVAKDLVVSLGGGEPNGGTTVVGLRLRRGTRLAQQLHHLQVASFGSTMQWRPTVPIGCVDLRALAEQNLHHLDVAMHGGDVQARPAVTILRLEEFRRPTQEQTDH